MNLEGVEAIQIDIDVSVDAAGAAITPTVEFYDEANSLWVILHTGDVIDTDEQHETIRMGPTMTTASELAQLGYLPANCRLHLAVPDSNAMVYGVNIIKWYRD